MSIESLNAWPLRWVVYLSILVASITGCGAGFAEDEAVQPDDGNIDDGLTATSGTPDFDGDGKPDRFGQSYDGRLYVKLSSPNAVTAVWGQLGRPRETTISSSTLQT